MIASAAHCSLWPRPKVTPGAQPEPTPREPYSPSTAPTYSGFEGGHLLSTRRSPFDNAESRLTTYKRHVEGHYRLGETLEGERANLVGCDASP